MHPLVQVVLWGVLDLTYYIDGQLQQCLHHTHKIVITSGVIVWKCLTVQQA